MARPGTAWLGGARHGLVSYRGKSRHGLDGQGTAGLGTTGRGEVLIEARRGMAMLGEAWHGLARHGEARFFISRRRTNETQHT